MLTPANTSDVHQLMTDFGLWARVRPEGALTRSFWDEPSSAKTYTMTDEDGLFLISLNEKYAPIKVKESDDFKTFGRVLN